MDALLYLMRHGAAEDTSPTGRDADRQLTPAGRATVQKVAFAVQRSRAQQVGRIIASPLVRAQQTAEIMRAVLGPHLEIETDDDLTPDGSAYDLASRLGSAQVDTLLVGHQPNIEMVARGLIAWPPPMAPQSPQSTGVPAAPASRPSWPSGALTRLPSGFRTATIVGFQLEGHPPPYPLVVALDPSVLSDV